MTKYQQHKEYDSLYEIVKNVFMLPNSDNNFTTRQVIDYHFQQYLMKEMSKRIAEGLSVKKVADVFSNELTRSILNHYVGSLRILGISAESLRRKYRDWNTYSENEKSQYFRYSSIIVDKSYAIKRLGLNEEVIKSFFKFSKETPESLAKKHKLNASSIKSCLSKRTRYKSEYASILRREIDDMVSILRKERKALHREKKDKEAKLFEVERKLIALNALKENRRYQVKHPKSNSTPQKRATPNFATAE